MIVSASATTLTVNSMRYFEVTRMKKALPCLPPKSHNSKSCAYIRIQHSSMQSVYQYTFYIVLSHPAENDVSYHYIYRNIEFLEIFFIKCN